MSQKLPSLGSHKLTLCCAGGLKYVSLLSQLLGGCSFPYLWSQNWIFVSQSWTIICVTKLEYLYHKAGIFVSQKLEYLCHRTGYFVSQIWKFQLKCVVNNNLWRTVLLGVTKLKNYHMTVKGFDQITITPWVWNQGVENVTVDSSHICPVNSSTLVLPITSQSVFMLQVIWTHLLSTLTWTDFDHAS